MCSSRRVPPCASLRLGRTDQRRIVVAGINIAKMVQVSAPGFVFAIPRVVQEGALNIQGGQRSKKRKSPCAIMPPFPSSRTMLSPRACFRSPSVRQETSPSAIFHTPLDQGQRVTNEIDLNFAPEDYRDDSIGQENGDDPVGQANGTCDDTLGQENGGGDDPVGQEDGTGDDPLGEGNARKNLLVPNEKRRAIFEALLGRARSGNLKGSETKEVSVQFSVPIRTVQRIWKKKAKAV